MHGFRAVELAAAMGRIADDQEMQPALESAERAAARELCLSLGGSCAYAGKLGVDY